MANVTKQLIIDRSRYLRKNQTRAEKKFWRYVRKKQLAGLKFLRQHPLLLDVSGKKIFFIADFYCDEYKLIVEIDGGIHELQKDYDERRTLVLDETGFRIIRFSNKEIFGDIDRVLEKIKKFIEL